MGDQGRVIHERFETQVGQSPGTAAVVDGDRILTYEQLDARSSQLAHHLRSLGVGPGCVVGVCLDRSAELVISIAAVLKSGAAYVPLDPAYPSSRLTYILSDARVPVVISQEQMTKHLTSAVAKQVLLDLHAPAIAAQPAVQPTVNVKPDDLAYVIYTSGSTGRPKGVMVTHRNVTRLFEASESLFGFASTDVWTLFHSCAFDVSVWEIWGALLYGGCLVIVPYDVSRSPRAFHRLICERGVTVLNQTPSAFFEFMRADAACQRASSLKLRWVLLAGESLDVNRLQPWFARHGDERPRLMNLYGITETTVHLTWEPVRRDQRAPEIGSIIGRPLPDMEVLLLDTELRPVAEGQAGEICTAGPGLARGYLNRPDLTAQRFVPNPLSLSTGQSLYRSGDRATRLPDGRLKYLGRIDQQIKVNGYRLEPEEIEAVLRRAPSVAECAVGGKQINGDLRLVAYLVAKDGHRISTSRSRRYLEAHLPDHMIPSLFVVVDQLPVGPNGKIDRSLLPAPQRIAPDPAQSPAAARTQTERRLHRLWAELLPADAFGIHDNFIELGGHSLLAGRLFTRVYDELGVDLSYRDLADGPTVSAMAKRIDALAACSDASNGSRKVRKAPRGLTLPASFGQEQLWFAMQCHPERPIYNEPFTIRFQQCVDAEALRGALNEIIRRHEVYRTTLEMHDGSLVQVIHPCAELAVPCDDWRDLPTAEREAKAHQLATRDAEAPFDFSRPPWLRAWLTVLSDCDHRLYLVFPHAVVDAVSIYEVFLDELWRIYEALRSGQPAPLSEPALQYVDFAWWQRHDRVEDRDREDLAYWRKKLAGAEPLALPTDRPRSAAPSHRGARRCLAWPEEVVSALKQRALEEGATLYMALLAAFQTVLWRYTRQEDIVVGTVAAGRSRSEFERMHGYFLNILVLRAQITDKTTFAQLLGQVREVTLEACAHQDLPFVKLAEALDQQAPGGGHPLFRVMMVMEPALPLSPSGWTVSQLDIHTGTAKFDLTLELEERNNGIIGRIEYDTDLFDQATIDRMIRHLEMVMRSAVASPEQELWRLEMLPADERKTLEQWGQSGNAPAPAALAHTLFEEQVLRTPQAPALICRNARLSYQQLNNHVNQLAHHLRMLGVGVDTPVAICLPRCAELVVAVLAVLKAGGAYVPLDPNYPDQHLNNMLQDSGAPVLIATGDAKTRLHHPASSLVALDDECAPWADCPTDNPDPLARPDSLAYIMYTSGSTGRPKGAAIEHHGPAALVAWALQTYSPQQLAGMLFSTSVCFDLSVFEVLVPLSCGGAVVLVDDLLQLLEESDSEKITFINTVPSAMAELLRRGGVPSSARVIALAGEPLPRNVAQQCLALEHVEQVYNLYGPTECTVYATWQRVEPGKQGRIPIGRPITGTTASILDAQLQPVPVGIPGELCLGGAGVGRGYWRRPQMTAERFVPDPCTSSARSRLYRTGDLCRYLTNGEIDFLGRLDHQVKIRGYRVETGEVEAALLQQPRVRECVVAAMPQPEDDGLQLVAYLVPDGALTSISELREALRRTLPDHMIPTFFVPLDTLPRTPNGKIDRRALPVPGTGRATNDQAPIPPTTDTQRTLCAIWARVLNLATVGIRDNFLELGGHSLRAARLVSHIERALGVPVPLRRVFEEPTIEQLAAWIQAHQSSAQHVAEWHTAAPASSAPLSFGQERFWFLDHLMAEREVYNVALGMRLWGRVNRRRLQAAIDAVVRRQAVLRTSFVNTEGCLTQKVESPHACRVVLATQRVAGVPPQQRDEEAYRRACDEARRHFDLGKAPLMRVKLFRIERRHHLLVVTVHHIICDDWSLRILLNEIAAFYRAGTARRRPNLPDLPIQYCDYVIWRRAQATKQLLQEQLNYWRRHLDGAPQLLQLPTDRPRPPVQVPRGTHQTIELPADVAKALRSLARAENATLFMTTLAVFAVLLKHYSHQEDLVIGTPISHRDRPDIESLVGMFLNTLPLRINLKGDPTFRQALRRVRESALAAYMNQDVSFAQIVNALQPPRSLSHAPLFQTMFVLIHDGIPSIQLPGVKCEPVLLDNGTAKLDMLLSLIDDGATIGGFLEYNTDLFEAQTAKRLCQQYVTLCRSVANDPDRALRMFK